MFLAGVVGALVLAAAAVLLFNVAGGDGDKPKPQPTVAKKLPKGVKCQGASCAGKDPENMGCGGEHAKTSSSSYVGGSFVEVRYSKVCRAGWARVTGAGQGDSVKVTAGKRSETGAVGTGNDAYTAMVPAKSEAAVRACVTGSGGTRGCTTPGTTSPSGQ
ncbi:DUF2690 domain-containing protein [Streptomyces sp. ODS28]|uniref:DUF2690 domain-containing protein n=1 Tax=Streptomyces sp. ODS28 TaxID=3136688 RepID=UPI0031F02DB1